MTRRPRRRARRTCAPRSRRRSTRPGSPTATSRSSSSTRSGSASSTATIAAATSPPTCSRSRSTAPAPAAGPRELGDVVICPEHTADLTEAAVHGVLHLCGYDHETDDGEMLALQARDPGSLEDRSTRTSATRAGFVGLAGRPNVGKSTLVNAIVGAKVAIVSDRPQTTRRASRGVATDVAAGWQLVLVDLPGVQRPRDVLTERMQRRVEHELDGRRRGPPRRQRRAGDRPRRPVHRRPPARGATPTSPVICAVNKIDRLEPARDDRGARRGRRARGRRRGLPDLAPSAAPGSGRSPSASPS